MFYNDLEFLLNEVSLFFGIGIIMLQSRRLQGCHFFTSLTYQTLYGSYSWHRMAFLESMHQQYCCMQIQQITNIESNYLVGN